MIIRVPAASETDRIPPSTRRRAFSQLSHIDGDVKYSAADGLRKLGYSRDRGRGSIVDSLSRRTTESKHSQATLCSRLALRIVSTPLR